MRHFTEWTPLERADPTVWARHGWLLDVLERNHEQTGARHSPLHERPWDAYWDDSGLGIVIFLYPDGRRYWVIGGSDYIRVVEFHHDASAVVYAPDGHVRWATFGLVAGHDEPLTIVTRELEPPAQCQWN